MPYLIIVLGLSGSGKTTFARALGNALQIPIQSKDSIKEILANALGCEDLQRSRELGQASMHLLYQWAETQLSAGRSCIIESTFNPRFATSDIQKLQATYSFTPLQIRCQVNPITLRERIQQRVTNGQRHASHFDHERSFSEILASGAHDFLDIGGQRLEFDTTNVETEGYQQILSQISNLI